MSALRIVLADDHELVRAGFRALLERFPDFQVAGEASNGREALRLVEQFDPTVALLDLSMPDLNGLETTVRIAQHHPRTRSIILSMHSDEEYVRHALAVGAAGYLLKNSNAGELELAVRAVARGDTWLSPGVSKPVAAAYAADRRNELGPFERLTSRQREVLQMIAEGHSTKAIAQRLALSVKTVEAHRAQIMLRVNVRTLQGLVRYAIRVGIISMDP